jgi:hypothetical protein
MKAKDCGDFKWKDLLARINKHNVIPVIGEGLYWVRTHDAGDVLLYPYLAEKFTAQMKLSPLPEKETFYQAVFRYLKENPDDYLAVNDFLVETLKTLYPVPDGPLWKLARINTFSLFINTTYDLLLEQTLKNIRSYPTEAVHYTIHDKGAHVIDPGIFKMLKEKQRSLIFNIYGSAARSITPAYTEKDILETIVALQKDMEVDRENKFFQRLESSSLLFMGCQYDDWLFRFFIRTMTNKSYDKQKGPQYRQFIGDNFQTFNCGGLIGFLKAYDSEVYYSSGNRDFVDQLFEMIAERFPGDIISEEMFPGLAFISFHGGDRETALQLAARLQEDGLNAWYDKWDLQAGDVVDEKIGKAISGCPVFIPIISNAAKQLQLENGKSVKYHIREWEWALGRNTEGQNPRVIIPVVIDDTPWIYEYFKKFNFLKIPGGERAGEYEKLQNRLREILHNPQQVWQP